jgi:hypothetical protein
VIAVAAGYLTFALPAGLLFVLTGKDPHAPLQLGFAALSVACGTAFAALGGYLAALIARRLELKHAAAVAVIIAVLALFSLNDQIGYGSVWWEIAALVVMAPAAALGGYLRAKRVRRPAGPAQPPEGAAL